MRTRRRRPAPLSASLKKLGDRLREARLVAGISHFTRAHVSAIELGKIRPAMRSLEHMARKLGRSASYFLDDAEAERSRKERELEVGSIGGLVTFAGAPEALRRAERLLDSDDLSVRDICRVRLYAGSALNLLHRGGDGRSGDRSLALGVVRPGGVDDVGQLHFLLHAAVGVPPAHVIRHAGRHHKSGRQPATVSRLGAVPHRATRRREGPGRCTDAAGCAICPANP